MGQGRKRGWDREGVAAGYYEGAGQRNRFDSEINFRLRLEEVERRTCKDRVNRTGLGIVLESGRVTGNFRMAEMQSVKVN